MKKHIKIFCTLGPSSLNKQFLNFAKGKISIFRINMSHINIKHLKRTIKFIRKFSNIPICIDTEGAQIRSKVKAIKKYYKGNQLSIYRDKKNFNLYPDYVFENLKKNDLLNIGFEGLVIKIIKKTNDKIISKVMQSGKLENNKGVYLVNRKIKLNFLTQKDFAAINIAKKMKIKNFALSFTNDSSDIKKFNKLLPKENKFFKIETKKALIQLNKIIPLGKNFLIDRGDLSNEVETLMVPYYQRLIVKKMKKGNKNIFIATNFLESMVNNPYPNRGEANDIFSCLEMGVDGLVLAGETAIGKYPIECVLFLKKMIRNSFSKYNESKK